MARKKAVKKYTLEEFKAWLEGVEEIQPANWSPDSTQWKMIRDKIDSIIIPIVVPPRPAQAVHHQPGPTPRRQEFIPPQASSLVTGDTHPMEVLPAPEMTAAAKAALQGNLPKEIATDPSHGSKTPNIDTMDGKYDSNFG